MLARDRPLSACGSVFSESDYFFVSAFVKCLGEIISWEGERALSGRRLGRTLNSDPVKRFRDALRYLGLSPRLLSRVSPVSFPVNFHATRKILPLRSSSEICSEIFD